MDTHSKRSVPIAWPAFLQRNADSPLQHVTLRLFLLEGLFSGASMMCMETFLPLFALAMGAGAGDIGMMSAISHILGPATYLVGGYLAERTARHKQLYLVAEGLVGRGFLLLYPLVPIFFEGRVAVFILIGLHVVRMTFFRLGGPAQMAVTGHVVPGPLRGRFMSARSLASVVGELGFQPLVGGVIALYLFPRGYQLGFLLIWFVGLIGAAAFARMPVATQPVAAMTRSSRPFREMGQDIFRDRQLLAFLGIVLAWGLGEQSVRSFYSVHMVRNLGLDAGAIGLLAAVASLASLVGLPTIGYLSDRYGNRSTLLATGATLALTQLLWLSARNAWQLVPAYLLNGLAHRAFQVAMVNLLLAISRPERYARYSALHQAAATTTSVIGPLLGAYLFERIGFASNVTLAAAAGILAMLIAWRSLHEHAPAPA